MFIRVYPPFEGFAAERFLALVKQLEKWQQKRDPTELETIWITEQETLKSHPHFNSIQLKYDAATRILIDLARLRWTIKQEGVGIELNSPQFYPERKVTAEQISEYKTTVRAELDPIRAEQFKTPSVKNFIDRMENPSKNSKRSSIFKLIADGKEIFSRIEPALSVEGEQRNNILAECIRPYLQLIPGDGDKQILDEYTNISLGEIWRYFRYTWSIPQLSIPGRTIAYLIRDAGHPNHAIMGIAALNNTAMVLKPRDIFLGWNRDAFFQKVDDALGSQNPKISLKRLFSRLERNIDSGLSMIDPTGLVSTEEIQYPTPDTIKRLRSKGEVFSKLRENALKNISCESDQPEILQDIEFVDDSAIHISPEVLGIDKKPSNKEMKGVITALILKKRAFELSHLLRSRRCLNLYRDKFLNPETTRDLLKNEEFSIAVNFALNANKSQHVGSNILEITTCGAIPPYNLLLGGKLAALLMLSPRINYDYQSRYGKQPSIISSQLKNVPVFRDNRLVYLGTTSLYALGSTQYERLKLPKGTIAPDQPEIRYKSIGYTSGYGTVQFMPETVRKVEAVLEEKLGFQNVNSVFGEGPSPKLRKIRAGLQELGYDSSVLLKHNQPRKIYGISLCNESSAFLCGEPSSLPGYIDHPEEYLDATERIAEFWRRRWLARRLDHTPTIQKLKIAKSWKLSEIIPNTMDQIEAEVGREMPVKSETEIQNIEVVEFWKGIAHAKQQVVSDNLEQAEIERLHIFSPLEEFILSKVKDGFSIVLTGNAGDGKTHILRYLESKLLEMNAVIEYDATAAMSKGKIKPILNNWKQALTEGRPYCLAANEFPLYHLRVHGKKELPVLSEVDRQCRQRLAYSDTNQLDEEPQQKVVVIDMSLRNPLSPEFAKEMLKRILSDKEIITLAQSGNDPIFSKNYDSINNTIVQQRLLDLFDRLALRGKRTSVRELWIIISRLLFGNPTENGFEEFSPKRWYSERLFEADKRFDISDYLCEYCDPAQCSHPQWDLRLENPGKVNDNDWIVDGRQPVWSTKRDDKFERFRAIKRKFYFEHLKGTEVFSLEDDALKAFEDFINNYDSETTLKKKIIGAINLCYCPKKFSGWSDSLHLWIGHRYHEKPTISYIANQYIPNNEFHLLLPRLPQRIKGVLEYRPDHFLIQYNTEKSPISLRIDYPLYDTLIKITRGMPRHLVPDRDINRLDMFMEKLQTLNIPQNQEFLAYNIDYGEFTNFNLSGDWKRYKEVKEFNE